MAHLNLAVYLRALKQGLQLLPYIKSHRIFRQCQFNHQFNIARAQYSDSSDQGNSEGQDLVLKKQYVKNRSTPQETYERNCQYRNPSFIENRRNSRKAFESNQNDENDHLEEMSNFPVDNGGLFEHKAHIRNQNQFDKSSEEREGRYDRNYGGKGNRFDRNENRFNRYHDHREDRFDRNQGRFDRSYEHREDRIGRKYGGRESRFDRNHDHRDGRFDRNEGRFDRNYEDREGRFDRNDGRFDRGYEHREGRFDSNHDHKQGRFNRNEGRFDRSYEHRDGRFDKNDGRFDRNYEDREGRFDRSYEHRDGRFDRNQDRFDRSYEHRESRFDKRYGSRFDRNEGRFDRNYEHREDRFDRKYGGRESRFDRNHNHREGRFDRNYEDREGGFDKNYNQRWMKSNDQKDQRRRHGINSNSIVNKLFSHADVQMKFTDEELSGKTFYEKPERNWRSFETRNDRDVDYSHKRDKYRKKSKSMEDSLADSEFEEDYEGDEDLQDVLSDPDKIALRHRTRNYKRDGAYKWVRYDRPRFSTQHEDDGATSDLEADIENYTENETFVGEKAIRRSQSDPQINNTGTYDEFGDHGNKDVRRKWKKSFGSLNDKKYDRRSDEENDEDFVKPHRRLSATGRNNETVWYAQQMKKLAKKGQIKEAVDVLEKRMLERDRVQPDHYTFSVLINILARARLTDKAFKIYNKMKKMGFYANGHIYSALFNACANSPWKEDGLQRAENLRQTMIGKEWEPNYITSTAMMKAFGKCGDLKTCFEIMDEICVKYPTELKSDCFSTLLSVCITDQQNGFKLALEVWHKMQVMGIKPTGDVYNFMLKAVRDSHFDFKLPEAEKSDGFIEQSESPVLSDISEEKSLVPSENLPNLLIERHTDIGELLSTIDFTIQENKLALFGGADTVLKHMKSNQVEADIRIFSLLLDCSEHTIEAEDKLLKIMKEHNVRPDQEFCNSLIRRRALRHDNDNAKAVLHLITDNYLQPNMDTFTNLALTCYQMNDGLQLLKDIEELDSQPTRDVFFNLVRSSGLNFHYKTQLLIKMEELDIKPDQALLVKIEQHIEKGSKHIVKMENKSLNGEKDPNLQGLQKGFENFMKYYKGWLHRTDLEKPEHPYHILRKDQSNK